MQKVPSLIPACAAWILCHYSQLIGPGVSITDWVWNWDRDLPYSNVWQVIIKCQRVQKVKVALLSSPAVACGRSMAECVLWIALNCVLYLDLWRFVRPPFHSQQSRIIMSKYIYKTQQTRIIMSKYIFYTSKSVSLSNENPKASEPGHAKIWQAHQNSSYFFLPEALADKMYIL